MSFGSILSLGRDLVTSCSTVTLIVDMLLVIMWTILTIVSVRRYYDSIR